MTRGARRCRRSPPPIPSAVRARYDLVSFDPRGTGKSRPVECVDDAHGGSAERGGPDAELRRRPARRSTTAPTNPSTSSRSASRATARGWPRSGAATWPATWTGFVPRSATTRCRTSGYSYGTVIGAVYAQMFPERVGRMVLDSPVDLSASALEELRGNSAGFEQALDDFLARLRVTRLVRVPQRWRPRSARSPGSKLGSSRACSSPPPTSPPGSGRRGKAGVAAFYTALISALYDKQYGWPALADVLCTTPERGDGSCLLVPRRLVQRAAGRRLLRQHRRGHRRDPVRRPRRRRSRAFADYAAEYHRDVAKYPFLGGYVGSTVLGCDPRLPRPPAGRAARRRPRRPARRRSSWSARPATRRRPTPGAEDLATRLAGSRLLTFDSTEHTAYTKNDCIDTGGQHLPAAAARSQPRTGLHA